MVDDHLIGYDHGFQDGTKFLSLVILIVYFVLYLYVFTLYGQLLVGCPVNVMATRNKERERNMQNTLTKIFIYLFNRRVSDKRLLRSQQTLRCSVKLVSKSVSVIITFRPSPHISYRDKERNFRKAAINVNRLLKNVMSIEDIFLMSFSFNNIHVFRFMFEELR